MAPPTTKQPRLRILCFGNSLTCGHPVDNPYAGKLKEKLEEELSTTDSPGGSGASRRRTEGGERRGAKTKTKTKTKMVVECEVDGVPGDLVTKSGYIGRMEESWAANSYDWTIVLGGTNDLGWGVPEDKIIEGLERAWDVPLSRGGKVLALTIPQTKYRDGKIEERREKVNAAIRAYKKTNFFHFDLHAAVPYHDMPAADRDAYWDPDGVHLTAAGYDLVGVRVADALVRIVRLAEAQDTDILGPGLDPRQRRAIEELIVEEERGDPRLLSQGYIVVRRKDLD